MEKEFCTYTQALRLKELGFDEPCFGFYDDVDKGFNQIHSMASVNGEQYSKLKITKAPTFSQAFRWFRENYGFHIRFLEPYNNLATPDNKWRSSIHNMNRLFHGYTNGRYIVGDSYEEAELACLTKLIEIVESKSE